MRCALAFIIATLASFAAADQRPVVVELFTSQGCSACPPADDVLLNLANRDDVIALGLHVDYWDYLGWQDGLGRPEHAARQRAYAAAMGRSMIYTPQMVINGQLDAVGSKEDEVLAAIERAHATPDAVDLKLEHNEDVVQLMLSLKDEAEPVGRVDILVVRWIPQTLVEIGDGENKGETVLYVNAVTRIEPISAWNGATPFTLTIPASGASGGAILIQKQGQGPILAAQSW